MPKQPENISVLFDSKYGAWQQFPPLPLTLVDKEEPAHNMHVLRPAGVGYPQEEIVIEDRCTSDNNETTDTYSEAVQ